MYFIHFSNNLSNFSTTQTQTRHRTSARTQTDWTHYNQDMDWTQNYNQDMDWTPDYNPDTDWTPDYSPDTDRLDTELQPGHGLDT